MRKIALARYACRRAEVSLPDDIQNMVKMPVLSLLLRHSDFKLHGIDSAPGNVAAGELKLAGRKSLETLSQFVERNTRMDE